jgi:hypothetical protein
MLLPAQGTRGWGPLSGYKEPKPRVDHCRLLLFTGSVNARRTMRGRAGSRKAWGIRNPGCVHCAAQKDFYCAPQKTEALVYELLVCGP